MSSTLNVITFNVRGLGNPIKRKRVLTFLKKKKKKQTLLSFRKHICPMRSTKISRETGSDRSISLASPAIKGELHYLFIRSCLSYLRSNTMIVRADTY